MAARLNVDASIDGGVSASASVVKTITAKAQIYKPPSINPYTGAYEYTPTDNAQTIPIFGLTATRDIVINPIPSNYGKITWDGSTLTVS